LIGIEYQKASIHIHVEKADGYARIELETLKVTDQYNLNSKELKKVLKLVKDNNKILEKAWNEYHGK
jgi:hypothetical protein